MNITIRDRESSSFSSVNNGSVNFNFNPSQDNSVLPDVNTSTTDQFQASPETIKAGIGKEKDFNVDSKDDRIQQTSMKYYASQLNTIKALNDSGKLAEMLEQVGSTEDTSNSWGYSLKQILDKAQIKRDGKTLSPSQLAEYLKNDKDGKIKESINSAIADIQGTSSFKEKLELANDKHDAEAQFATTAVAGYAGTQAVGKAWAAKGIIGQGLSTGVKTIAGIAGKEVTTRGVGSFLLGQGAKTVGGTLLRTAFGMNPLGLGLMVGGSIALWALNNTDQGKALKENVANAVGGAWEAIPGVNQIDDFVGDLGDNIGYQLSKFG